VSPVNTALQIKIYSLLTGNATLMNMVTGVYDIAPDNAKLPYITIGNDSLGGWDTHTSNGVEGYYQIDVWTDSSIRLRTVSSDE